MPFAINHKLFVNAHHLLALWQRNGKQARKKRRINKITNTQQEQNSQQPAIQADLMPEQNGKGENSATEQKKGFFNKNSSTIAFTTHIVNGFEIRNSIKTRDEKNLK